MKDIHFNLKPNELTFGKEINEELRSIDENFKSLGDLALTTDELAAIQGANTPNESNPLATVNDLDPVKKLTIKLTQAGETPPTPIVLQDTTVSGVMYARISAGKYHLISGDHEFVQNKTIPEELEELILPNGDKVTIELIDDETIEIMTYLAADTAVPADGVLVKQPVYIEIYL